MSWFVSDELISVELAECRCPRTPHAHDVVWLRPELDAAGGWQGTLAMRNLDTSQGEAALMVQLGLIYLEWGIARWTFVDDDGEPVPVSHELIRKLSWDAVLPVAEKAAELYGDALTRPLVARGSRSSTNGHAVPSTSRKRRSSSVPQKP